MKSLGQDLNPPRPEVGSFISKTAARRGLITHDTESLFLGFFCFVVNNGSITSASVDTAPVLSPVPEDKGFAPAVSSAEIMIHATFRSGSLSSGPVCISHVKYARFEPLSKHPWPSAASY